MGDYRARRIAQVLAWGPCDVDSLKQLQMDTYSIQAEELLKAVRPHLPDGEVTQQLDRWDFSYDTDSQGAVLFEAFYDELMVELFGLGGLGEDRMRYLLKHTGVFATLYANFDRVIVEDPSAWLQGRSLRTVCQNAVQRVPTQRRTWGEVNRATIEHMLLGGRLPRWLGSTVVQFRSPVAVRRHTKGSSSRRAVGRQASFR